MHTHSVTHSQKMSVRQKYVHFSYRIILLQVNLLCTTSLCTKLKSPDKKTNKNIWRQKNRWRNIVADQQFFTPIYIMVR